MNKFMYHILESKFADDRRCVWFHGTGSAGRRNVNRLKSLAYSDAASTLSGSTVFSTSKDAQQQPAKVEAIITETKTLPNDPVQKQRRGMRQRVRDVVADLGRPPTARSDAREGRPTPNHVDVGPAPGTVLMGSTTV
ncbi:hypothetical protein CEP52_000253 [Fusarium oligoseptatum]|uniref:Uncharacterized protein n=1 Tax=Fusarium oligoseptatum TaxID=2604345 RepID=A0A428UQP5_9HYPO|nr:hypothetical protein CEP52_000253 [Fusarium oligoseptatum]